VVVMPFTDTNQGWMCVCEIVVSRVLWNKVTEFKMDVLGTD